MSAPQTVTVACLALPYFHLPPGDPRLPSPPVDCTQHAYKDPARRPADFHVNPRYGQACGCCGRDGRHVVDPARPSSWPKCVTAYGLTAAVEATARGWTA